MFGLVHNLWSMQTTHQCYSREAEDWVLALHLLLLFVPLNEINAFTRKQKSRESLGESKLNSDAKQAPQPSLTSRCS